MKGLILAGGLGSRMRPLTATLAKQLLPIANRPLLHYAIDHMVEVGITEIAVVLGHTGHQVRDSLGDGSKFGARITYIDQVAPLGLAHCVLIAESFLGNSDFLMYLGDNMFEIGLTRFIAEFEHYKTQSENIVALIALIEVEDPSQFGVAVVDADNYVTHVQEKPKNPMSNQAIVGTYAFTSAIFEAIKKIQPSERGELEITDAIQQVINDQNKVAASAVEGWWMDTGNPGAYLECNRRMLEIGSSSQRSSLHTGNGKVIQPSIIGSNVVIQDSIVGPFACVSDNCEINGINVRHSVVLQGAFLRGTVTIAESIIGRNCHLDLVGVSGVIRLIVGDDCVVEVTQR